MRKNVRTLRHPFAHDLHLVSLPGTNARTIVCLHGYGANFRIIEMVKATKLVDATLVGFNFPDHDLLERPCDPEKLSFGTMEELLPALYVLKHCVVDECRTAIDTYGFSAGGAALINILGVLNTKTYDEQLKEIGISEKEKATILLAIQKGIVLLDAPLKSVEEIMEKREPNPELEAIAHQYRRNHFCPLDSIKRLHGLSLNILLYFEEPDEIVGNRDDAVLVELLKNANKQGSTTVITGSSGGHATIHWKLWQQYAQRCT